MAFRPPNRIDTDAIPWFLALAFADNAFRDHKTPQELFLQTIPVGAQAYAFEWKQEVRNVHIFRPSVESTSALTKNQFNKMFRFWMQQAGFPKPVKIQRIRYYMDPVGATENPAQNSPLSPNTKPLDLRICDLSNAAVQVLLKTDTVRGYPLKLSDDERDRLLANDKIYQSLKAEITTINVDNADRREAKARLDCRRSKLKCQALREYREKWLNTKCPTHPHDTDTPKSEPDFAVSRQAQHLLCAPNHLCVVAMIGGAVKYSRDSIPALVEMLSQMALSNETISHRPREAPVKGRCPVTTCNTFLTK